MKMEMKILDDRLNKEEFRPSYATPGACGIDLRACRIAGVGILAGGEINLLPGGKVKIGCGFALHLVNTNGEQNPEPDFLKFAALILPRSGLGTKHGIRLSNTVGLVDSDYQGEFIIAVENAGSEAFTINALDRLAQAVIVPVITPGFVLVNEFNTQTKRGTGGFGSTGRG